MLIQQAELLRNNNGIPKTWNRVGNHISIVNSSGIIKNSFSYGKNPLEFDPDAKEVGYKKEDGTRISKMLSNSADVRRDNGEVLHNAASGFEADISTLTTVAKNVIKAKFYDKRIVHNMKISDYMPVKVGDGAWGTNILNYITSPRYTNFNDGFLSRDASNKISEVDINIDTTDIAIYNWAKQYRWTLFEQETSMANGRTGINFNIAEQRMKALKTLWDLGVQELSFLGSSTIANLDGLLNQSSITANTSLLTKYISNLTQSEFNSFLGNLLPAFLTSTEVTQMANTFLISYKDYVALSKPYSETFQSRGSRLEALEMTLQKYGVKVLPSDYCDMTNTANSESINKFRYALYNSDPDTMVLNIPIDLTFVNSNYSGANSFEFFGAGYGQVTGLKLFRPKELLYFDFTSAT